MNSSALPTAVDARTGRGATILLVEDEPAVLRVTARILQQLGYVVFKASGGAEALDIVRKQSGRIDLLLTDVLMPDMNGVELAHAVEQLRPTIRVLYMSGYTADALRAPQAHGRPAQLVQKPFARDTLSRAITGALATS